MKKVWLLSFMYLLFTGLVAGQEVYNGFPVLQARTEKADFRIGNDWLRGAWQIAPQIQEDTLLVPCFGDTVEFGFYTDLDSIIFTLKPGHEKRFYVHTDKDQYALTLVRAVQPDFKALDYDTASFHEQYTFWYRHPQEPYLQKLRAKYHLDSIVAGAADDLEKVNLILHWVHTRWNHNGNNTPEKPDAISILEEAAGGKNFRCVEYGIVSSACLNAIGLKARVLGLKTEDVETRKYGAGHVAAEVYLPDRQKWVFLDGQWDAIPLLHGQPLNAVEFQKAIAENLHDLEILSNSNTSKFIYVNWIYPYLYYLDTGFDQTEERRKINGKQNLMLVPLGAKEPHVFQIKYPIDNCLYTHAVKDFYKEPDGAID